MADTQKHSVTASGGVSGAGGGPLAGRRALVTGGGRGVGRAVSLALAAAGADVAMTYVRDADAAKETVEAVLGAGRRAFAYAGSVAEPADNAEVVARAVDDLGGLDILISNAGIASRGRAVADTDAAELERVMRVHALGPHELCRLALPRLRERSRSDIVFISSVATDLRSANGAPYNMAKAAVEMLARTLAREERRNGVRVNVVAPGLVATEMGERLARATRGVSEIHELDARSPFGRVCAPEDVAEAVLFVVTASYANDQRITVDGGTF